MQILIRASLMVCCAGVLSVASVVHGLWTDRWCVTEEMTLAVSKLENLPTAFGQWKGEELKLDPHELALTGCRAAAARSYTNRITGETIQATILCGRPGPASVHTPDICYRGAGYEPSAPPEVWTVETPTGSHARFWTARFCKQEGGQISNLRILWSWTSSGVWQAADNPRKTFAAKPALFKLYIGRPMALESEPLDTDPCNEFIRDFLPELQKALFADS